MKRLFFVSLIFLKGLVLFSQNNVELVLNKINSTVGINQEKWSFCLLDGNGQKVISYKDSILLTPASIVKAITTSIAIDVLGPDFTFKTKLAYSGEISSDSILNGDIIIIGGGDPTFASNRFGFSYSSIIKNWTAIIKNLGIHEINGRILIDESFFAKPIFNKYWADDDVGNYYGASPTAFMFNENTYKVIFKKGQVGQKSEIKEIIPSLGNVKIVNEITYANSNTGDNVIIFSRPFDSVVRLTGTIPANTSDFDVDGALPNSSETFKELLEQSLTKNGIRVNNKKSLEHQIQTVLNIVESPPLADIIQQTNVKSINIYAESILWMIGYKKVGIASTENGLKEIYRVLLSENIDTTKTNLYDGNGLSRSNRIISSSLARYLNAFTSKTSFDIFYNSLPIAGESGGLKNVCKEQPYIGRVHAKTGYMTNVRCFAGYIDTKAKGRMSFCLMFNDYTCSNQKIKVLAEELFKVIIDLK